jgi:hypothetical protein
VTGAFSGLGGYMGKGLGVLRSGSGNSSSRIVGCAVTPLEEDTVEPAPTDPNKDGQVLTVREGELMKSVFETAKLISHAGTGVFLNQDGTAARDVGIAWPSSPEDIGMYIRLRVCC